MSINDPESDERENEEGLPVLRQYYNAPDNEHFLKDIKMLHLLCRKKSVGFSIVYAEAANDWYGTIDSAAPTEEIVTRSGSLCFIIERLSEHLKNI